MIQNSIIDQLQVNYTHGYKFHFANNQRWHFNALDDSEAWLHKFAGVLELEQCPYHREDDRIIIMQSNSVITGELVDHGWKAFSYFGMKFWSHESSDEMVFEIVNEDTFKDNIYNMWAAVHTLYRTCLPRGGTPLHCALVQFGDIGVLFAAPGGGGKTTTYNRLPDSWNKLCDDEVLILPNSDGKFMAHPFPTWSSFLLGRPRHSWNSEQAIGVDVIFFIQQSETTSVELLEYGHSAALINQSARQIMRRGWSLSGSEMESNFKRFLIDTSIGLAKSVRSYKLHLPLSGTFWDTIVPYITDGEPTSS